jgi:hypothetical protein
VLQDFPPVERGPEVHKKEDEDEDDGQDQRHLHERLPPLGQKSPRGSELPPAPGEGSRRPPGTPAGDTTPRQATLMLHFAVPAISSSHEYGGRTSLAAAVPGTPPAPD